MTLLTFLPECNTNDDCTYKNKNVCSNYKCMCNPGHVKDLLNNCQPCGENQIPIEGKCVACPAGQIRAEDKTSCQSMFILITVPTTPVLKKPILCSKLPIFRWF